MYLLLVSVFGVCFDHAFGCVSQISFDVDVGGINTINTPEGGAIHLVQSKLHLAFNLPDRAALERVWALKVCDVLTLQCCQLRNLLIRAIRVPGYLDCLDCQASQVENGYFFRRYFASLASADDPSLILLSTAAQEEA